MAGKPIHGEHKSRLNLIWRGTKYRCSPKAHHRKYYYDKGITFYEGWTKYEDFRDWALANGYADNLTIDRIDPDKGYSPENCRWITQSENTKRNSNAKLVTINGETHDLADWSKILGISLSSIRWACRTHGFTPESYLRYRIEHRDVRGLSNEERQELMKQYSQKE